MCTLLRVLGKYGESEALQRDQLALSYRILGENHPTTIWCIISPSQTLFEQKKYLEARSFVEGELAKRQELVSKSLLDILVLVEILGNIYMEIGDYRTSEFILDQVIAGRLQETWTQRRK
jgi:hypothetical protein